jgi:pyruvate/2-oxoglutarate dehydrogenase complex dihydrolipoamide acyltransferase (E2) component
MAEIMLRRSGEPHAQEMEGSFMRNRLSASTLLASTLLSCALILPQAAAAAPRKPKPVAAKAEAAPAPRPRHRGAAPAAPMGKLADAVIPSAYRLDLSVDPAKERFSGHVEIDAAVKAASRYVYLHGKDLAVSQATVTIAGKTYAATWKQVDPTGVALLTFAEDLPAGQATFAFDYDAPFPTARRHVPREGGRSVVQLDPV